MLGFVLKAHHMPTTANTPPPSKPAAPPAHMTGAELQTLREAAGLSREALAERVGVQARTVKHWEHGRGGVPADVADVVRHLAGWVAEAAHRLRMQARQIYHGQPGFGATQWGADGQPLAMQTGQATQPAQVVLMRYRETADMMASTAPNGTMADTHGAAVAQAMQGLALDDIPARVVWFDPATYGAWIDAQRLADTPDMRAHWAQGQGLAAQAIPPRGDQPPPDFALGYGTPSTGTARTRSRP